jgi:hypothetical protein
VICSQNGVVCRKIVAMGDESQTTPAAVSAPVPAAVSPESTFAIFEAERASGPSGAILQGVQLQFAEAVAFRREGKDVVVCGDNTDANRRMALQIESAVGPPSRPQFPHKRAGPLSLPHFHQLNRSPDKHTFYETDKRKSRKKQ